MQQHLLKGYGDLSTVEDVLVSDETKIIPLVWFSNGNRCRKFGLINISFIGVRIHAASEETLMEAHSGGARASREDGLFQQSRLVFANTYLPPSRG